APLDVRVDCFGQGRERGGWQDPPFVGYACSLPLWPGAEQPTCRTPAGCLYPSAVRWRLIRWSASVWAVWSLAVGALALLAVLAVVAAVAVFGASVASAGILKQFLGIEQIQDFSSDVRIQPDGSLLV